MTHTLRRWGNSLAVRIPLRLVRAAGLADGSAVELRLEDGRIVMTPVPAPPTLERLLGGVTAENLHRDFAWGLVDERGREAP